MALPYRDYEMDVEEHFKLRESDHLHRYEYVDGEIYMMTGDTVRHSRVGFNLAHTIETLLGESPCVVYNSDICFQVSEDRYVCPDVAVSCDPRDSDESADEEELKTVHYPRFVAEVHSPSTTKIDLNEKLTFYQDHPDIQEFLFVSAQVPKVRLYRRESNDRWMIYILGMNDEVKLTSLGIRFPVANLYKKTRLARRAG